MKRSLAIVTGALLVMAGCSTSQQNPIETENQKASYAIGYQTGNMFGQGLRDQDIDIDLFLEAMKVSLQESTAPRMTLEEMTSASEQHQRRIVERQEAERDRLAKEAVAEGENFRNDFRAMEGVIALESGILYIPIVSGSSQRKPTLEDVVVAHYEGRLIDGSVFDSSLERGEAASFPLNRVIPGWQEALQLMSEGDKWKIVIPPDLAYGEQGAGGKIGPNATLVFEVELIEIKAAS